MELWNEERRGCYKGAKERKVRKTGGEKVRKTGSATSLVSLWAVVLSEPWLKSENLFLVHESTKFLFRGF